MKNIPSQMKGLLADPAGSLETYAPSLVPVPVMKPGHVLIKVQAAGINRADLLQRKGKYPPPEGITEVLGMEAAGEIVAVAPDVSSWKIGDVVMTLVAGGACAEYVLAIAEHCLPIPKGFSINEAAATMEATITVWANLFESAKVKLGQTVLVHGGSSGIGTFAIQMLKAFDIIPIVTVSTSAKADACRKLGAAHVINYAEQDFVKEALDFTNRRGIDAVLDMVGGEYVNRNLQALAPYGRHVSIATQKGSKADVDVRLIMAKQLVLTGSTLRGRSMPEKARLVRQVAAHIGPLLDLGQIKPVIFQAFPLEKAGEAHKVMETSAHIGKIVLTV